MDIENKTANKIKNKNQKGTILIVVLVFIIIIEFIFLLSFKIYLSSEEIIKNHKLNEKEFNNYLNPKNNLSKKIKTYPADNKLKFNFNKILKNSFTCKESKPFFANEDFISEKFCNISKFEHNAYLGNIVSNKALLPLNSAILISSGNIALENIILTQNVSFIISLGDIKILDIIGNDPTQMYFVIFKSSTNNITVKSKSNVIVIKEPPSFIFSFVPTYKKNILFIDYEG